MIIDANDSALGVWHNSNNEKDFYHGLIHLAHTWGFIFSDSDFSNIKEDALLEEKYVSVGKDAVVYLNSIVKNGYKFIVKDFVLILEDDPSLDKEELKNRKNKRKLEDKTYNSFIKERDKKMKKAIKRNSRPWDLLNPSVKHVTDEVYWERYNTCSNCEFFIKKIGVCSKCSCFMKVKCSLETSFCPVDKWKAVS